jgi:NADH dehydrogenase (ubiquinone) 1 alpha subcomplex subunit 6
MAALRNLPTGLGSASFEEARGRSVEFFRVVCRSLPKLMDLYNLHDVTTLAELRGKTAQLFRKHAGVTNAKVGCCTLSVRLHELLSKLPVSNF